MAHLPPPPGKRFEVDISGRKLHAMVSGEPDLPTLLLDSGLGANSLAFSSVIDALGKRAYVVALDRAGYAWSDPAPPSATLDSDHAVEDARMLLKAMGRTPPYVLGGLSYGGINMLRWTLLYPDEVTALALIESSAPDMYRRVPRMPSPTKTAEQLRWIGKIAGKGWLRFLPVGLRMRTIPGMSMLREPYRSAWAAIVADTALYETAAREADALESSLRSASAPAGALGDLPLVVLTGAAMWGEKRSITLRADQKSAMLKLRAELAALSTRGEHQLIEGAGHLIPLDAPEAFISAMVKLIDAAKVALS